MEDIGADQSPSRKTSTSIAPVPLTAGQKSPFKQMLLGPSISPRSSADEIVSQPEFFRGLINIRLKPSSSKLEGMTAFVNAIKEVGYGDIPIAIVSTINEQGFGVSIPVMVTDANGDIQRQDHSLPKSSTSNKAAPLTILERSRSKRSSKSRLGHSPIIYFLSLILSLPLWLAPV